MKTDLEILESAGISTFRTLYQKSPRRLRRDVYKRRTSEESISHELRDNTRSDVQHGEE